MGESCCQQLRHGGFHLWMLHPLLPYSRQLELQSSLSFHGVTKLFVLLQNHVLIVWVATFQEKVAPGQDLLGVPCYIYILCQFSNNSTRIRHVGQQPYCVGIHFTRGSTVSADLPNCSNVCNTYIHIFVFGCHICSR